MKRLLLRESQVQPLLLVFEDLHWIDAETQALLDSLVESLPAARILLLVNYRPEYQHGWGGKTLLHAAPPRSAAAARAPRSCSTALLGDDAGLAPLKRAADRAHRGQPVLPRGERPDAGRDAACSSASGAPIALARPLDAIQVPATVQAVLAARIDRLPAGGQAAAPGGGRHRQGRARSRCCGRSPSCPTRSCAAGWRACRRPSSSTRRSLFPELEYTFKHALTHEVAYGSLLHERRRALHARIVEAIERLYADRLAEHVERLAYHALRGEVWDKAVVFSGARVRPRPRASPTGTRSRPTNRPWPPSAAPRGPRAPRAGRRSALRAGALALAAGLLDRAMTAYRDAEKFAAALGDDRRVARVCTGLAYLLGSEADHHGSIEAGERALSLAARASDPRFRSGPAWVWPVSTLRSEPMSGASSGRAPLSRRSSWRRPTPGSDREPCFPRSARERGWRFVWLRSGSSARP